MIKFADSKVKFLLAISGISTSVIITYLPKNIFENSVLLSVLIVFLISFLLFLIFSLLTIYPRPNYNVEKTVPELIFFKHIAERPSSRDFIDDYKLIKIEEMLEDLLQEIYQLSKIANLKFNHYDRAWKCLLLQLLMFLVMIIHNFAISL